MHSSNSTISARNMRPSLFFAIVTAAQWLARKMNERRNCNALMELSDEQLKGYRPFRGQTESDVHVYSRY
ncbi:hypothetical protein ACOJBO_39320 [Rhizobium beringeri]